MKIQKNLEKELTEIKNLLTSQTIQNDEPLTIEQACIFTGFKKSYLYKLTHFKQINYFKPNNKKIYFLKSDLRDWILRNKQVSIPELESLALENRKERRA